MKVKPSHYQALGIQPTATPDEIKRAYRKLAAKHHPDKATGDHERMARITVAYEVLSDPERRANYDATGKDQLPHTEERIGQMLMQAFNEGLQKEVPHNLDYARKWLDNYHSKCATQQQELANLIAELQVKREKISTSETANFFHMVIDRHIANFKQKVADTEAELALCDIALSRLSEYVSSEEPEQAIQFAWTTTASTSGR